MVLTSSLVLDSLILLITLIFVAYKYFTRNFDYWTKRGVYSPKPIPFFGNFYDAISLKTTNFELMKRLYEETDAPYFGVFVFDQPALVLKSPQLIKNVLIKDFNVFCDRSFAEGKHNTYISNWLFTQKNPKWKKTRAKLSPLFTLAMVKNMFITIKNISDSWVKYLERSSEVVDAKYIAGHFSTEMIARCFYGIDPHCFQGENSTFAKYVHKIYEFTLRNVIIHSLYLTRPNWIHFFKLDFIAKSTYNYFLKVVQTSMEARKNFTGKITNVVDLLVSSTRNKQNGDTLDIDSIRSNAIVFIIAGHETTSSLIAYSLYELALHEDIQERLRKEINEMEEGVTFEGISHNKYLDMVMHEVFRKYAVLPFLDRTASCDYRIEGTDLVIEKGTPVYIPMFAMFRDPKYFPNPDQFDPERFSENVNLKDFIFYPFGEGPRSCIGKRLGMITVAMAIVSILLKFKLEKCESTPVPIEFEPKCFMLNSKGGLPIKITPIVQ